MVCVGVSNYKHVNWLSSCLPDFYLLVFVLLPSSVIQAAVVTGISADDCCGGVFH